MSNAELYVEVHGFNGSKPLPKWERIPISEITTWRGKNEHLTVLLKSVQSFVNKERGGDDPHIAPVYFDFDSNDPILALSDARSLYQHLVSLYGDLDINIWFSGNKGFHIFINPEHFGIKIHKHTTYHIRYIVDHFVKKLDLTTADLGVYTIPRLWRIANTPNKDHYKIPITIYEFLSWDFESIKKLAEYKRDVDYYDNDFKMIELIPELNELYLSAVDQYGQSKSIIAPIYDPVEINDQLPPCIKYIFNHQGLLKLGYRNRTSVVLSAYCKDAGKDIDQAKTFLNEWLSTIPDPSPLTSTNGNARITEAMAVIKTVYASEKYHFSCGSILDCGVPRDVCTNCESLGEKVKVIEFKDFAEKDNIGGQLLEFEADVVGKDKIEMLIPKKITGHCVFDPDKNACISCPMADYFDIEKRECSRTVNVSAKSKWIVELLDQRAGNIDVIVKKLFGVYGKSCGLFQYDIEWQNAQKVHLATAINRSYIDTTDKKYYAGTGYVLLHGIEMNRGYRMRGRVYPNFRNREATLIIESAEPLQTLIDNFVLTPRDADELEVFKPSKLTPDGILEKIRDIHSCFRDSFIFIFGRDDLILAEDLVFHSVRKFYFQRQLKKGWLDILIVGDTRQGKTEIAKKLMDYYQVGTFASGETSSRTGLLYTIQMTKEEANWVRFGLMPRSNGMLLVVDEIHGMPSDDFKEFTQVRSEGVLDVMRAGVGKTPCEVRLICIANPRTGASMSSYGYPVQAITEIPAFSSLEDVARFTYAYGVKAGEVSDDDLNRDVNEIPIKEHPYTREKCRNLILWLWTLKPDDIIISPDTEKRVLTLAKQISLEYVPDIPLIESADVRQKLMIVATAIAGRTYNSDGKRLIVLPAHVDTAYNVLNMFYKSEGLDYYGFSDDQARMLLSSEQVEQIEEKIMREIPNWEGVIRYMIASNSFNKTILYQSTGINKDVADRLITLFLNCNFLQSRQHFLRKTAQGRNFMRNMVKKYGMYSKKEIDSIQEIIKDDDF